MYQKQKNQLNRTLLPLAPDLLSEIQKAPDEPFLNENNLFSQFDPELPKKKGVIRPAFVACALLCLLLVFHYQTRNEVIATVSIQGRSTVEMSVNKSNKIINIHYSNTEEESASAALEGSDLGEGIQKAFQQVQQESEDKPLVLRYHTVKKNHKSKKAREIVTDAANRYSSETGKDIDATYQAATAEEVPVESEEIPVDTDDVTTEIIEEKEERKELIVEVEELSAEEEERIPATSEESIPAADTSEIIPTNEEGPLFLE